GSAVIGVAPARLPDVYAGAPLRAAVKLRAEGGELSVRGKTPDGAWEESIDVPAVATGQASAAVVSLYGREGVEDLEMRRAAGLGGDADGDPVAVVGPWPHSPTLEAGIAWERTTRQGPVEAGQVIRLGLCLKADGPFLAPSQFSVTTGKGEVLIVSLRDAGRG